MPQDLVAATPLPVSADLENGYADDPEGVAETVRLADEAGLAGPLHRGHDAAGRRALSLRPRGRAGPRRRRGRPRAPPRPGAGGPRRRRDDRGLRPRRGHPPPPGLRGRGGRLPLHPASRVIEEVALICRSVSRPSTRSPPAPSSATPAPSSRRPASRDLPGSALAPGHRTAVIVRRRAPCSGRGPSRPARAARTAGRRGSTRCSRGARPRPLTLPTPRRACDLRADAPAEGGPAPARDPTRPRPPGARTPPPPPLDRPRCPTPSPSSPS